jgi:hypothetical protein
MSELSSPLITLAVLDIGHEDSAGLSVCIVHTFLLLDGRFAEGNSKKLE